MKILLDECMPFCVRDFLRERKYEVDHVKQTPWAGFSNSELYAKARENGTYRVFITTDRHFIHPEKFRPTPELGIVYLRVAPTVGPLLVDALKKFLDTTSLESIVGKLAIVRRNDSSVRNNNE